MKKIIFLPALLTACYLLSSAHVVSANSNVAVAVGYVQTGTK